MTVQPFQLPQLINVPQLNFAPLDQAGDAIAGYLQRNAFANALPTMFGQASQQQPQGNSLATLGQPPQPAQPAAPTGNGLTQDQMALLAGAARKYGLDPNYLIHVASLEGTGQNPSSSAQGLGQFIDSTAKQYGVVRGDDASAADGLARFTRDNQAALTKALGRPPTPGELYLAHQQGATGATNLLANPNAPAASVVGSPAVVNNGGAPNETASQFVGQWTSRFPNLPPAITQGSQASATSQPGGAALQPPQSASAPAYAPTASAGAPAAQPSPAAVQSTAGMPQSAIPPQLLPRIQAMIRAGGPAQQFAMALLQKYVVPPTPVVVNEGAVAVNPYTGAVIARGQPKSYSVAAGGELVTPGAPGAGPGGTPGGASSTYQNTNGLMSDNAIALQAQRAMSGDFSVFSQTGRGNIGQINNGKIIDYMAAHGATPETLNAAKAGLESQIHATTAFGTGQQGNTIRSLDVGVDHLTTLRQLAQAMQNGDVRSLNALKNIFYQEFGYDLPTTFEAARPIVAAEIAKAVTGTGGALGDREELSKPLNAANSWGQLAGVIDKAYIPLMAGQLHGLQRQYEYTTKKNDFQTRLSANTKAALNPKPQQSNLPKVTSSADANSAIAAAKAAIAAGANPKDVNMRLQQMGVPPLAGQ